MTIDTRIPPVAADARDEALQRIRRSALAVTSEASDALDDVILGSFRRMQESRILDLRSDAPERVEKERLARSNLMKLIDLWVEVERARGGGQLTLRGFKQAYHSLCPVYPCG